MTALETKQADTKGGRMIVEMKYEKTSEEQDENYWNNRWYELGEHSYIL